MTYLLLSFYWPLKCCISRRVRKCLLLFVGGGETFRLLRLLRKVNLSITATTLTQQSVPVLGEDSSAPLTEVITEFMKRWSGERGDAAGLCIRSILTRFQKQRRKKINRRLNSIIIQCLMAHQIRVAAGWFSQQKHIITVTETEKHLLGVGLSK